MRQSGVHETEFGLGLGGLVFTLTGPSVTQIHKKGKKGKKGKMSTVGVGGFKTLEVHEFSTDRIDTSHGYIFLSKPACTQAAAEPNPGAGPLGPQW